MLDRALSFAAYEVDTVIADEPAPEPLARPRTVTDGALTMQVYTMGKWHRRTPDLSHTACGLRIDSQRCPVRREELSGDLCAGDAERDPCFTTFELVLAGSANRKDYEP